MTQPLVEVTDLQITFPSRDLFANPTQVLRALWGASFTIPRGEVLGLVGESGSGKTTTGRAVLRLLEPSGGTVRFDGADITHVPRSALRPYRRRMQMIFQDPYSSLNPRLKVRDIVGEAFIVHGIGTRRDRPGRVAEMLHKVGLPADSADRYPHEFSGGQRQRIGIARALAVGPDLVVADEPVSALDVSVQAQVLNLLLDLQQSLGLTMLFIAHDLAVVQYISDRVAVLYLGRIMEIGPSESLHRRPRHPYTAALLDSVPEPDPARRRVVAGLSGEMPSPFAPPSGCVFRTRCPHAIDACAEQVPELREVEPGHAKACLRDDIL
jgi:oligopeptide transport system ATP-binding protein